MSEQAGATTIVEVLGPLRVRRGTRVVEPASAIARRLLCALASRAPDVVPIGRLIDVAWPSGDVPRGPEANLHTHIARIRRLCGGAPGEAGAIETHPGGYRLAIETVETDLAELQRLVAPGLEAVDDASTARLDRALALWRGRSLHDIADTEPGQLDALRLDELRRSIAEARFESLVRAGASAGLVHDLDAFSREHPYRERPVSMLMRALNDLGRHADALAAYQRLRRALAEDLGLDPSPALRSLEEAILDHRLPIPARPESTFSQSQPQVPPVPLSALVGRRSEMARLAAALGRSRLVTLTGPGGVGKTRLAMELAAQRRSASPDSQDVFWCDLVNADRATAAIDILTEALQLRRLVGETALGAVLRMFAGATALLILDNCEHAVDEVSNLAHALLAGTVHLRILTTSRTALDLAGEEIMTVEPLPVDTRVGAPVEHPSTGVELFIQRCVAAGAPVSHDAEAVALAVNICRAVDGLPLGIELAAAQARHMSLHELEQRLAAGGLDLSRRRGPERQRSIAATIDWSYQLLPEAERRLLTAASTFAGSFDAAGASAMAGEHDSTVTAAHLRSLADLSLVRAEAAEGETRFRLLGTTRRFGRRISETNGTQGPLDHRLREWAVNLVTTHGARLRGPEEPDAATVIEHELDNIREAFDRGFQNADHHATLTIGSGLAEFAFERLRDDVFGWIERVVDAGGSDGHPLHARTVASLGLGLTTRGDLTRAASLARAALESAGSDAVAAMRANHALGLAALYSGRLAEASEVAASLRDIAVGEADRFMELVAFVVDALAHMYGGDVARAQLLAQPVPGLADLVGSPGARAWASYLLGETSSGTDPEGARSHLEQAISFGRPGRNVFVIGVAEVSLSALQAGGSDADLALVTFRGLVRHWSARNDWTHQWTTLQNLAPVLLRVGRPEGASVLVGALRGQSGGRPLFGTAAEAVSGLMDDLPTIMGRARFDDHLAQGAAMSRRDLLTFVLAQLGPDPDAV